MSTLTFSPWWMNSGTWISWPVSTVAGLVRPVALSPTTPVPDSWVRDVLARGLRTEPPASMTEGGWTGFQRWDPFTENRVDRAISRTRAATFPLFGLDPDDPRD